MKGNQGLEALAELCGGARKASVDANSAAGTPAATMPAAKAPMSTQEKNVSHTVSNVQPVPQCTTSNTVANTHIPLDGAKVQTSVASFQPEALKQWQQALAGTTAFGNVPSPAAAAALLSGVGRPNGGSEAPINAMQQLAYYQYMQAQATVAAQAALGNSIVSAVVPFVDQSKASVPVGAATAQQNQIKIEAPQLKQPERYQQESLTSLQKIIPGPPSAQITPKASDNSMRPPAHPSQVPSVPSISSTGIVLGTQPSAATSQVGPPPSVAATGAAGKIIPLKPQEPDIAPQETVGSSQSGSSSVSSSEDKKLLKRAANRRSAQLSRKRKKQFIEELKEENDELRRKEQILRSIPDLIVVFDSSGKLWFVSHSVSRLLDFTPAELEGNSFWDRLCDDSVRLLKAAFMDALAARKSTMDTAPLGSGVWELRLVDKDGTHKIVTLNGVVHFSGDSPECVCSIRPRDEKAASQLQRRNTSGAESASAKKPLLHAHPSRASREAAQRLSNQEPHISNIIKPHQSVISKESSRVKSGAGSLGSRSGRRATQISDEDSVVSESGSE